ncbi:MAG: GNAT family N-acetyltransferase [Gammaproteobacteria bacterium]|nr:GNAT family N-acetyltransferase [Gammaproteobacteria bacterium]
MIKIEPYTFGDEKLRYDGLNSSKDHLLPWIPYAENYTMEKSKIWIENAIKAFSAGTEYAFKILNEQENFLGEVRLINVTINPYERQANIALWIQKDFAGQGVASAALKLATDFAFNDLKLQRLQFMVLPDNERSIGLIRKVGGQYEGQLRNQWSFDGVMKHPLLFSLTPAS